MNTIKCALYTIISALILTIPANASIKKIHAVQSYISPRILSRGNTACAMVSPDGDKIVYQRKTSNGWRICVGTINGENVTQITNGPGDDADPVWRPDGKKIAFSSNRYGHWSIFIVNTDGTSLKLLHQSNKDERHPQWSPNLFELPYSKDPYKQTFYNRKKGDLSANELKILEQLAKNSTTWNGYSENYAIHTAARYYKLLFVAGSGDSSKIATIREDGQQYQILDDGMSGAHISPSWSNDSSELAYIIRKGATSSIYYGAYPETRDLRDSDTSPLFGIDIKQYRANIHRIRKIDNTVDKALLSRDSRYIAVATGNVMRLYPVKDKSLPVQELTLINKIAPYSFSWMPDSRTALVTVSISDATKLDTVTFDTPLIDVENICRFDSLDKNDYSYIDKNGFVASGIPQNQMFGVYESTDYENLPIYITTDSLLHLNHLIFDYILRDIETNQLTPDVISLINSYLKASINQANAFSTGELHKSAIANTAFFGVAARLITGDIHTGEYKVSPADPNDPLAEDRATYLQREYQKAKARLSKWNTPLTQTLSTVPDEAKTYIDKEIDLIQAHNGPEESPIFGGELVNNPNQPIVDTRVDYSDFIPRGHYTRSEILRRYFLVSRWLGDAPFSHNIGPTRQTVLIVAATDSETYAVWKKMYDTMSQFTGESDDQNITQYQAIARSIYGSEPITDQLQDDGKLSRFITGINELPGPVIASAAGPSFRFMPLPYTPDAEIMQDLVYDQNPPDVGSREKPRYFALGLDVMAVLGSQKAYDILNRYSFINGLPIETQYDNYNNVYQQLLQRFSLWTEADWNRSLYRRTVYALLPLLKTELINGKQNESYMESDAWTDKQLNTALATWAELKHDTMPKQPLAIEMGGEGGISERIIQEQPVGYVEPSPEVYRRIQLLIEAERSFLTAHGYLTPDISQRLKTFTALLSAIRDIEKKQRQGTPLSSHDVEFLRFYGGYQEHLTMVTSEGGENGSAEGNDMAIIADVSTARVTQLDKVFALEEGIGRALPIYVAVPYKGHRHLTRGAIFTYYEFTQPAEDRLTDEKWRALLDSPAAPPLPYWVKSFISHIDKSSQ